MSRLRLAAPPVTRGTRGAPAHRACLGALGLVASWAIAGCDPPPAEEILPAEEDAAPFAVASVNVQDDALADGDDLIVRFSRPLDRASVGPRALSVTSSRRRRISGSAARVEGSALRIPGELLRSLMTDETAVLRIEGGASPCAVRAADGSRLEERFTLAFRRARETRPDLVGPSLAGSRPADGAVEVAPGATIELRFDEPVAAGAEAWGDAVTLRADGAEVPARLRLSADRRRLLVRPARPLAAGVQAEVELHRCIVDDAGNPLAADSARSVSFRTRPTTLCEIEEDFTCDEYADRAATGCAWDEIEHPGVLVARCGTLPLPALDTEPTTDLGDRDEIRFQIRVHGDETTAGFASGLRLRFARTPAADPLRAIVVEGGPAADEPLGASFQENRDGAELAVLALREGGSAWEPDPAGGAVVDVPFDRPLALEPGRALLLDVAIGVAPGARLAAAASEPGRALLRGAPREHLAPCAALLVSGAAPSARSRWYDAGADAPRWRSAVVETLGGGAGVRVLVEYQTAPPGADGRPDLFLASAWVPDPAQLPPWRFARFRVRFEGAAWEGAAPHVDRIALRYEVTRTPR